MDIAYASTAHHAFVTNVGLITSTGPHGENIMAAEWTHHLSYKPGLIAVSLGPTKATTENIRATKEFGVNIAADDQNVISSLAGGSTGKAINKIEGLKELGFIFAAGKMIKAPMVEGAALQVECKLIDEEVRGDHVVFIGEALSVTDNPGKTPLIYNRGRYWSFGGEIPKPSDAEKERLKAVMQKHAKS